MKNKIDKYNLPPREVDILYTIWEAGRPLMASEIANENLKLATVHTTLKRMLKKDLLRVVDFAKSGNVFGRCYEPTFSMLDFELDRLTSEFIKRKGRKITLSSFTVSLLKNMDTESALKELDKIEQIIKEKRKEFSETK